jgi:hypothetical protein
MNPEYAYVSSTDADNALPGDYAIVVSGAVA